MRTAKRRSGDYSTIDAELADLDAVNPRVSFFLHGMDWWAVNRFGRQLKLLCLSKTIAEDKADIKFMDREPSYYTHRPVDAAAFMLAGKGFLTLQQAREIKGFIDTHFMLFSGDQCRIVEVVDKSKRVTLRYIHIQFLYKPKNYPMSVVAGCLPPELFISSVDDD